MKLLHEPEAGASRGFCKHNLVSSLQERVSTGAPVRSRVLVFTQADAAGVSGSAKCVKEEMYDNGCNYWRRTGWLAGGLFFDTEMSAGL